MRVGIGFAVSAFALTLTVSTAAYSAEGATAPAGGPIALSDSALDWVAAGQNVDNWGQVVTACNLSSCYPGGTNRGTYVSGQAQDNQGPGYGYEIQTLVPLDASAFQTGAFHSPNFP